MWQLAQIIPEWVLDTYTQSPCQHTRGEGERAREERENLERKPMLLAQQTAQDFAIYLTNRASEFLLKVRGLKTCRAFRFLFELCF